MRWPSVGRDRRGGGGVAGGQLGVERGRALGGEPRAVARAGARIRRRAQVQVGQRGAHVEPGAADHDRAPSGRDQRVDLGVRQARVRARGGPRGDRKDAEQPVLEPRPVGGRGRAGEDLQPGVELQRVGGHRDGVLAVGAQPLGERDRHLGLADAGRTEERDEGQGRHGAQDRRDGAARRVRSVAMGVRIGSGLSTEPDARFGAAEAAAAARDALGGRPCDLAVVFASGAHLAAPEATLEGIHDDARARRAGRVRRRRGDRRDARDRGGHRGVGLGCGAGRRRGADVPRRGRVARRRRRGAERAARARRRGGRAAAGRPVHVPDRPGAAPALRGRADAAAARRPRVRPLTRRRDAAAARRRGR